MGKNIIGKYVPNTVIKVDIRDYISNQARIIATYRKNKTDLKYSDGFKVFRNSIFSKKVDFDNIVLPDELNQLFD